MTAHTPMRAYRAAKARSSPPVRDPLGSSVPTGAASAAVPGVSATSRCWVCASSTTTLTGVPAASVLRWVVSGMAGSGGCWCGIDRVEDDVGVGGAELDRLHSGVQDQHPVADLHEVGGLGAHQEHAPPGG